MILHDYHRSSAAYRVRIALNLKGLTADAVAVSLKDDDQHEAGFRALNPQGLVPVLEAEGQPLSQSLAIIEYLEEQYPRPPLLPRSALDRARVRALALLVACDIHPLNNLRVLRHLTGPLGQSEQQKAAWVGHWIGEGFAALEAMLASDPRTQAFCHGRTPTLADVCLVPQVYNARRNNCDLEPYPTIRRINEACMALPAFVLAAPERKESSP
jgi:maleylacetoacetate isomerase